MSNKSMEIEAHEFIHQFTPYAYHDFLADDSKMYPEMWENAKAIALITINEMIKVMDEAMLFKQSKRDYYKALKEEIEKYKP